MLAPLADDYDYVVLDCPPRSRWSRRASSTAADAAARAADPVDAVACARSTSCGVRGREVAARRGCSRSSRWSTAASACTASSWSAAAEHPGVSASAIPAASDVELMGLHRVPGGDERAAHPAAAAFRELWERAEEALRYRGPGSALLARQRAHLPGLDPHGPGARRRRPHRRQGDGVPHETLRWIWRSAHLAGAALALEARLRWRAYECAMRAGYRCRPAAASASSARWSRPTRSVVLVAAVLDG